MKFPSFRSLLILAVAANLFRWLRPATNDSAPEKRSTTPPAAESVPGANLFPSPSNLGAMAEQWKQRMAVMPPEQRAKEEERLREEVRYFVAALRLPPEERAAKIRERIESLMNDPEIQRDWADGRQEMLARMSPEDRQKLFRKYVEYKKHVTSN